MEQLGKIRWWICFDLKPAAAGTGVYRWWCNASSNWKVRELQDVLAKSKGSSNPHNVVKA